jgi:ribosome-binding protein aMBF1 (putative translation factor)
MTTATITRRPDPGRSPAAQLRQYGPRPTITPAPTSFGATIARLRRRQGLSQLVCAELIGRSEDWLRKVEHNKIPVDRLSVLRELARVLKVDILTLIEVAP